MSVSEQALSNEWTPLKHIWGEIAEGWCKQEGERSIFMFRILRERFETGDASRPLTLDTILEAASISKDEVESWRVGDAPQSDVDATNPETDRHLPLPPLDAIHLTIYVRLKPPADRDVGGDQEISPKQWQTLEAIWKGILGLEAAIDATRLGLDGVRAEMEAAYKKSMTVEEKVHALQLDVVNWNKGKSRVHYALPKVREFIHRATWAHAVPERKRLEEIVEKYIEPRVPHPDMNYIREQLEHLQKDRQVLFAQGNAVAQECRGIIAEIQRAFSTLQRNAADRARKERENRRVKGKYL